MCFWQRDGDHVSVITCPKYGGALITSALGVGLPGVTGSERRHLVSVVLREQLASVGRCAALGLLALPPSSAWSLRG
ncbi:unnamed protein product [Caretta caretta]